MTELSTNSMNTYKMIPMESVLQDVYRLIGQNRDVEENELLESAASAMSHLYNYKLYERVMCIGVVDNFKMVLPDFYQVDAVLYKSELSEQEFSSLPKTFQVDFSLVDNDSSSLNYCNVHTVEDVGRVSHKCLYHLKTSASRNGWTFMTLSHSIATQIAIGSDVSSKCIHGCEYTYSISNNVMTVSENTGYVIVVLTRTPRDCDGKLLIPVVPLVNEALKAYILMELNERDMNMHKDGALGLYRLYAERWGYLSAAAVGQLNMLSFPESIELVKDSKYFRNDSPFRGFDKSGFEKTNIGYTDTSYFKIPFF